MINEEIRKILESDKDIQMQVLELQKIGKIVYEALNSPAFKIAYKTSTEALKNKIEDINKDFSRIEDEILQNEELINQKEKIENEYQQLQLKLRDIKELKEKNGILNLPENSPSLINDEISKIIGRNEDIIKNRIDTLQILNDLFANSTSDLEKQLSAKISKAQENLAIIENQQTHALIRLDNTPLRSMYTGFANEINNLVGNYNSYVDKIITIKNDLEEISIKHDSVVEVFKAHQLENETIFGALMTREGVLNHVNILRKEIEDRLLKFDTEIRDIIKKRDKLPIYQLEEIKKYQ